MQKSIARMQESIHQAVETLANQITCRTSLEAYLVWAASKGTPIFDDIKTKLPWSFVREDVVETAVTYLTELLHKALYQDQEWDEAIDWLYMIPDKLYSMLKRNGLEDWTFASAMSKECPTRQTGYSMVFTAATGFGGCCFSIL